MRKTCLSTVFLLLVLVGCGKQIKLPTDIPQPASGTTDTTYVSLTPAWTSAGGIFFSQPQDVHVGFDGHVYIADTGNDRVVELNQAGDFIAQYEGIESPGSVSQDRLLRLQATGGNTIYVKLKDQEAFDSLYTSPDLFDSVMVIRPDTLIDTTIVSPDSMVIDTLTGLLDTTYVVDTLETRYEAITADPRPVSGYATYFVCDYTRDEIVSFVFYEPDQLYSLGAAIPTGYDLAETKYPTGAFTYLTTTGFRLIFCQSLSYFSVQLLDGENLLPVIPRTDSSEIYWQGTFGRAEDVAVDEYENIFVVDVERHEIHKFSRNGVHILSFGGEGNGEKQFQNPMGIAYADKILYVADTGNDRILRFMLSNDIPH
jgi:hypothetical protein